MWAAVAEQAQFDEDTLIPVSAMTTGAESRVWVLLEQGVLCVRNRLRAIFYVVFGLAWAAVVCVALEFCDTLIKRSEDRETEKYTAESQARGQQAQASLVRKMDPEALTPPPSIPDTNDFANMDDPARSRLAIQRHELILACNQDGTVRSSYVPDAPPQVVTLARRVHTGETVAIALFGQHPSKGLMADQAQDCLTTLRNSCVPGGHQVRTFAVVFEDGTSGAVEVSFEVMQGASRQIDGAGVFISESIWEEPVFKYRKNVTKYMVTHKYHINNVGFRDDDVTLPKPPGVYRIVCVGASTTVEGYTNKMTYPSLLEARLRKCFGESKIEVINCGVIGLRSEGEVRRISDYLALQPDLIIHYNFINDVAPLFRTHVNPKESGLSPIKRLKWLLRKSSFVYRHFNAWLWMPDEEFRDALRETTLANLQTLCVAARQAHVDLALCSFACPDIPHLSKDERLYYDAHLQHFIAAGPDGGCGALNATTYAHLVGLYNAELRALCQKEGYLYVPVGENLKGGTNYFYDICHCYLAGIDRKAELVFDGIKDFVAQRLNQ